MMESYVYYISNGSAIKIGKTKDLIKRLKALQTSSPTKLELLGYEVFENEKEAFEDEKTRHMKLEDYRLEGEWFGITRMDALLMIDAFDGEYINQEDADDCFRYMCGY